MEENQMQDLDMSNEIKERQIINYKSDLQANDYKLIKTFEVIYKALKDKGLLDGVEMPYDIESLITERQQLRNSIDSLEGRKE